MAVSYTHLDVYKRQFLSGGVDSSYIAAVLMPDTTCSVGFDYNKFNETNYAAELSDKLGTVAYTHLDVYKRQGRRGAV